MTNKKGTKQYITQIKIPDGDITNDPEKIANFFCKYCIKIN